MHFNDLFALLCALKRQHSTLKKEKRWDYVQQDDESNLKIRPKKTKNFLFIETMAFKLSIYLKGPFD